MIREWLNWLILIAMFLASLGLLWLTAEAQHGHWTDRYLGANNLRCCGEIDCTPAEVQVWRHRGTWVDVEVDGTLLEVPAAWVHPIPADAAIPLGVSGYWCRIDEGPVSRENTRCVFTKPGMW
jgi:hypothetical protein